MLVGRRAEAWAHLVEVLSVEAGIQEAMEVAETVTNDTSLLTR